MRVLKSRIRASDRRYVKASSRLLAALAVSACPLVATPVALATSSPAAVQTATTNGVAYLRSLQQPDGSIAGFGGDWALTSFAAAGTAAANVAPSGSSSDARSWYRSLVDDPASWPEGANPPVTEFERASLIAYAAGIDPARVSQTQNLLAQIVARYQPASPGYYGTPSLFNGTVFGLLALESTKTRKGVRRVPQALLDESIEALRRNQHTSGGWSFQKVEGNEKALKSAAEPDMTGAAIAALCGAGVPSTDPTVAKGVEYLKSLLVSTSGAFAAEFGSNTDSNAWGVQGLNACQIDPQGAAFTTPAGKTPIDFLISQQLPGGSFKYLPSETKANEYSSQDAVRALAGAGFTPSPPKAKKAPQWLAEKQFSTSASAPDLLTLIVDSGGPTLAACAVTIAPQAAKTRLVDVLEAAETASSPAGCVSGFAPSSGKGAIAQIDGQPVTSGESWDVSVDGSIAKQAKGSSAIHVGDTIYLRLH
jgi:hypothetical protein